MPRPLPEVTLYTDGACAPNPGPGGWAAILLYPGRDPVELADSVPEWTDGRQTTSNRTELLAAVEGLEALVEPCRVRLRSDSTYLLAGMARELNRGGPDLFGGSAVVATSNQDLWTRLVAAARPHVVFGEKVAAHSGDSWNERADKLARSMIAPPALPLEDAAAVHVFTAANSPGGWSVLLRYRRRRRLLSGRAEGETVQRLQLRAALAGLTALKLRDLPVHVYTTSEYLRSGIQWWLPGWKRRDWHTAEGAAVPHRDLWLQLENAGRGLRLKYHLAREPLPPEMAEALAAATLACRAGA